MPKSQRFEIVLIVLLFAAACSRGAGTATPNPPAPATRTPALTASPSPAGSPGEPYSSFVGGYAFRQIAGWETDAFLGFASMQPPEASEQFGPGFLLVGGLNSRPYTLDEAFDVLTAKFADRSSTGLEMSAPYETTLAGAPALAADLSGAENGTPLAGRLLVALVNENQSFFAFGFARQEEWDALAGRAFAALLGSVAFFDPVPLAGPLDSDGQAAAAETQPAETAGPPDGFLWRLAAGGEAEPGGLDFTRIGGLAADSSGFLYVAGQGGGIQVLDPRGRLIDRIQPGGFSDFDDVALNEAGGGAIASAAWGSSWIMVLDFSGRVQAQFGRQGEEKGAFGNAGTLAVELDRENRVYVLDSSARLQVFDSAGNHLAGWGLEEGIQPRAIAYRAAQSPADDRLYILGDAGIWEYDLAGAPVRGAVGEDVLGEGQPQALAMDAAGNFYVAMRSPGRVVRLTPEGKLSGVFGFDILSGDGPWDPGGFHAPTAIAVSPDGNRVYVSDSGGFEGAYLTAFEYK